MARVKKVKKKYLKVAYVSEAAFQSEYARNIANGGVFLPTENAFEVRDPVRVQIKLAYCDQLIPLEGEVVRCVPPELAKAGASPGAVETPSCSPPRYAPGALAHEALLEPRGRPHPLAGSAQGR